MALALGACLAGGLPTVADGDVERARVLFPEATRARLESGRQTYTLRCGACHEPHDPRLRTRREWEWAVAEMSPRAGVEGERQALVLQYLTTFARR